MNNQNVDATIKVELEEISHDEYHRLIDDINYLIKSLDGGTANINYEITKKYGVTND